MKTKTSDSEKMPRKVRSERCSALDDHGFRCKNKGTIETFYHGDHELLEGKSSWVRSVLCFKHVGKDISCLVL